MNHISSHIKTVLIQSAWNAKTQSERKERLMILYQEGVITPDELSIYIDTWCLRRA